MGKVVIALGGGGGLDTDECTAGRLQVLSGYTAGVYGNDEPTPGSMPEKGAWTSSVGMNGSVSIPEGHHNGQGKVNGPAVTQRGAVSAALNCGGAYTVPEGYHNGAGRITANSLASQTSANAGSGHILSGYTAWVNGVKITGNVAVQSILSFSAAVYSSTAIAFTWKNPAKGAFSGVIIVGKTDSYPTSISDGTRWYKGSGNNSSANGSSSTTVSGFASGTTYYFRAFSYALKSGAEWVHSTYYQSSATTTKGQQTLTSSGTFTVPMGVRSIDIFCVGGGGGGESYASNEWGGGGGSGGNTATKKEYLVSPGQTFYVTIGSGGEKGKNGNTTSFGSVLSALGGKVGSGNPGSNGGSGGGHAGWGISSYYYVGGNGGSNGGNGSNNQRSDGGGEQFYGGSGQGSTTKAFGESSGTLYAGGGGGGGSNRKSDSSPGYGGSGGGGNAGNVGSVNTGGGGGGGGRISPTNLNISAAGGGSGICIVRWGY